MISLNEHIREITPGCNEESTSYKDALKDTREIQNFIPLITCLPAATVIIDAQSKIIAWNRAMEEITGITSVRMVGKSTQKYAALFYSNQRPVLADLIFNPNAEIKKKYSIVRKKDGTLSEHTVGSRFNGIKMFLQVKASPLYDSHGTIIGAVEIVQDITKRKLAEEALCESEERFRSIFETAEDCFFIKDSKLRYVDVNSSMERLFGIPAQKIIGWTDKDLFGEETAEHIMTVDLRVINGEIIKEEHTKPVNGVETTFHVVKVPLRNDAGKIVGLCGIARDITKRKRMEEALRESETTYRHLVENIRDVIYSVNTDGIITYISPAIESFVGYSPSQVIGHHYSDFIHKDDCRCLDKYFKTLVSRELPKVSLEYRLLTTSGDTKWGYFSARPVYDENILSGFQGTLFDITDRKLKEKALQEREQLYRRLTHNVSDGVALVSEKKLLFVNRSFVSMFNYPDSNGLIGVNVIDLIRDDYKNEFEKILSFLEDGKRLKNVFRGPCVRRNGREIWVELHNNLIQWDSKPAILVTIRDITKERERAIAVREKVRSLRNENIKLKSTMKDRYRLGSIIGKSMAMQDVYEFIYSAAASDAHVIIYGESGTGKELVARAIHDMSKRGKTGIIPVNCGAIPENLLESEFFGHKKGAFTGANINKHGYLDIADGGSLFLDEVGEISQSVQVKLLRAIEGNGYTPLGSNELRKSDVRIIAATKRNLMNLVENGLMREDFFYRIHILPITLPPLRDRKEDIPLLVEHFLKLYGNNDTSSVITGSVMDQLVEYDWPGNVRELENTLQRYLTLNNLHFMPHIFDRLEENTQQFRNKVTSIHSYSDTSETAQEKGMILRTLQEYQWNRSRTASVLGMSRNTLYRKMKQYNLNYS